MEILIILALVIVTILIVGYPFVSLQAFATNGLKFETPTDYDDLYVARETVFDALKDLQFEFATGKLSQKDYDALRVRYEAQAADVLRQIDTLKPRAKKAGTAKSVAARACPRCGTAVSGGNQFCTSCGAKL